MNKGTGRVVVLVIAVAGVIAGGTLAIIGNNRGFPTLQLVGMGLMLGMPLLTYAFRVILDKLAYRI